MTRIESPFIRCFSLDIPVTTLVYHNIKALDQVRKDEQNESGRKKELFEHRRLFMVPEGRMTDKQRTRVTDLSKQYKKTGRAFRIVQALDDFYASTSMDAALPPAADEGCCLDTETSQGGDTEFFQHAPDKRDLRRDQLDDSSGETQSKRFSDLRRLCSDDLFRCRKVGFGYACSFLKITFPLVLE